MSEVGNQRAAQTTCFDDSVRINASHRGKRHLGHSSHHTQVPPLRAMDYADETKQDYDELLIERNKSGSYWLHFAVRPKENRRKTMFLSTTN